jgi:hypothetical protein
MKKLSLILPLLILLCGCFVVALHPLYTEKDVIFDSKLVGDWREDKEEPDIWKFEKSGESLYRLTILQKEVTNIFDARLVKLQTNLFMDLELSENARNQIENMGLYGVWLVPGHVFFKVKLDNSKLHLNPLAPDWLKDTLATNPAAVKHENLDKRIILTASTEELQKFVLKYVNDTNAFPDAEPLVRAIAPQK